MFVSFFNFSFYCNYLCIYHYETVMYLLWINGLYVIGNLLHLPKFSFFRQTCSIFHTVSFSYVCARRAESLQSSTRFPKLWCIADCRRLGVEKRFNRRCTPHVDSEPTMETRAYLCTLLYHALYRRTDIFISVTTHGFFPSRSKSIYVKVMYLILCLLACNELQPT